MPPKVLLMLLFTPALLAAALSSHFPMVDPSASTQKPDPQQSTEAPAEAEAEVATTEVAADEEILAEKAISEGITTSAESHAEEAAPEAGMTEAEAEEGAANESTPEPAAEATAAPTLLEVEPLSSLVAVEPKAEKESDDHIAAGSQAEVASVDAESNTDGVSAAPVSTSKKIKEQLWQELEKLRERRGSAGRQSPSTSHTIDAPTKEMKSAGNYGQAARIFFTEAAIKAAGGTDAKCGFGAAPFTKGRRINVTAGSLRRAKIWFLDTLNYTLPEYVLDRAHCGHFHIAPTPTEADLCFPSCDVNYSSSGLERDPSANVTLSFEVPAHRRTLFEECEKIDFVVEPQGQKLPCLVQVPALHGVARPPGVHEEDAPWNQVQQRDTLLSFIGGTPENPTRIDEMVAYAAEVDAQSPDRIFSAPVLHTPMDGNSFRVLKVYQTLAWELYSSSLFAWQGGTLAHRSFYDCWMMGAIPVVPMKSAYSYLNLMDGQPFKSHLKNLAVVIPENISESGRDIIKYLQQIPPEDIAMRQRKIRQVAPFLQYGWSERADAFTAAIGTLIQRSVETSESAKAWTKHASARARAYGFHEAKPVKQAHSKPVAQAKSNASEPHSVNTTAASAKDATGKKGAHKGSTTAAPTQADKTGEAAQAETTTKTPAKEVPPARKVVGPHSGNNANATHTPEHPAQAAGSGNAHAAKPSVKNGTSKTSAVVSHEPKAATKPTARKASTTPAKKHASTTTSTAPQAAGPGDGNQIGDGHQVTQAAEVSDDGLAAPAPGKTTRVLIDLMPEETEPAVDHTRFLQVVGVCTGFVVMAGTCLLTNPGVTESMRNPKMSV